jgi:hypothetical protein
MITFEVFSQNWKRYAWSSFVTFGTFFILSLAVGLKDLSFEGITGAGFVGMVSVFGRLIGKAGFEGVKSLIISMAEKLKK